MNGVEGRFDPIRLCSSIIIDWIVVTNGSQAKNRKQKLSQDSDAQATHQHTCSFAATKKKAERSDGRKPKDESIRADVIGGSILSLTHLKGATWVHDDFGFIGGIGGIDTSQSWHGGLC
jgi:hypothetical protein